VGTTQDDNAAWPLAIHAALRDAGIVQVAYVPDGGHATLIERVHADDRMIPITLTTEEEGVAVLAGAWLGGQRGVLLMQSSGVGNCTNMLSLVDICRFPFVALVTMRGEWGEFNPWQVPMSAATQITFEAMGVRTQRADRPEDVAPVVRAALDLAFLGGTPVAVLLGQRLIGTKVFTK
jgi:sulfopyruvate decarboxylase alpha subunit